MIYSTLGNSLNNYFINSKTFHTFEYQNKSKMKTLTKNQIFKAYESGKINHDEAAYLFNKLQAKKRVKISDILNYFGLTLLILVLAFFFIVLTPGNSALQATLNNYDLFFFAALMCSIVFISIGAIISEDNN